MREIRQWDCKVYLFRSSVASNDKFETFVGSVVEVTFMVSAVVFESDFCILMQIT